MQSWFGEFGASMCAFWREDGGQDLIEYTLLLAFVCLASATMFIKSGGSIKSIWTTTNSELAAAAASATT
jgi:Flp pilus assembly pilin Flp